MRDFMIVAAEWRQAVIENRLAIQAVEQAGSTFDLMQRRKFESDMKLNKLTQELNDSATDSAK